jgi:hypothetical protein
LDEGGTEEVLTLFAFKADAEGFLEGCFDGIEAAQRVIFGAGASFAGVGGEQPGNVLGLGERSAVEHDASEKIGQQVFVPGKCGELGVPEIGGGVGEGIAFKNLDRTRGREFQEAELA